VNRSSYHVTKSLNHADGFFFTSPASHCPAAVQTSLLVNITVLSIHLSQNNNLVSILKFLCFTAWQSCIELCKVAYVIVPRYPQPAEAQACFCNTDDSPPFKTSIILRKYTHLLYPRACEFCKNVTNSIEVFRPIVRTARGVRTESLPFRLDTHFQE
jgi:hypothetical protein